MENKEPKKFTLEAFNNNIIAKNIEFSSNHGDSPRTIGKTQELVKVLSIDKNATDRNGEKIYPKIKENDLVLISKFESQGITIDEESYLIVRSEEILAIFKKA